MSNQPVATSQPGSATAAATEDPSSTSAHPTRNKPDPTIRPPDGLDGRAEGGVSSAASSGAAELSRLKVKLKSALRQYPDFPSPGVLFEDILPIFADHTLHGALIKALEIHVLTTYGESQKPDVVVGLDARGFLFGPSLALRIGAAFVPVRKQGKLPGEVATAAFEKEYGKDYFQMQKHSIKEGQRVIVVDDIIATGGSASAAGSLVKEAGGNLLGYIFMLELDFLKGRAQLDAPVYTLLSSQENKS